MRDYVSKHYRVERIARQRQDQMSHYALVTWMIVRRDDAYVMGEHERRRDAVAEVERLEAARHA